jgi:hypothetical protein
LPEKGVSAMRWVTKRRDVEGEGAALLTRLSAQSEYEGALDELSMAEVTFLRAALGVARKVLGSEKEWAPVLVRISEGAGVTVGCVEDLETELAWCSDIVLEHVVRHLHRLGDRGLVTWSLSQAGVAFRRARETCRAGSGGLIEGTRRLRECSRAVRLVTATLGAR